MYEVRQQKPAFPMPGLENFLKKCDLASVKMAVVTSDDTSNAKEQLEWMGRTLHLQPFWEEIRFETASRTRK